MEAMFPPRHDIEVMIPKWIAEAIAKRLEDCFLTRANLPFEATMRTLCVGLAQLFSQDGIYRVSTHFMSRHSGRKQENHDPCHL